MSKWILAATVLVFTCGQHISHAQAPPKQTVTQGQEWVAFDADYTSESMNGRYYRASDGSMRQEGATPDGAKPFIYIVNIARKEAYFYRSQDNTWSVRPVIVPAGGYRPMPHDLLLNHPLRQVRNVQRRPQSGDLFVPPTGATLIRIEEPITLVEVVRTSEPGPQFPFGRGPSGPEPGLPTR